MNKVTKTQEITLYSLINKQHVCLNMALLVHFCILYANLQIQLYMEYPVDVNVSLGMFWTACYLLTNLKHRNIKI